MVTAGPLHSGIRGQEDMSIHIAHQNIHFGDHGGSGRQLTELLVLLQFLHREIAAGLQIPHGQLAHRHRPDHQLIGFLPPGIGIAQGKKDTPNSTSVRNTMPTVTAICRQ